MLTKRAYDNFIGHLNILPLTENTFYLSLYWLYKQQRLTTKILFEIGNRTSYRTFIVSVTQKIKQNCLYKITEHVQKQILDVFFRIIRYTSTRYLNQNTLNSAEIVAFYVVGALNQLRTPTDKNVQHNRRK